MIEVPCDTCNGNGVLRVEDFDSESTMYGDYDVVCEDCNGDGFVESDEDEWE